MKIRVFKVFGHEVLRIETHVEATVSDIVHAMLAQRMAAEAEDEELVVCECCGEAFDPADVDDEDDKLNEKFNTMTEHLNWGERVVWDAQVDEDEDP